MSTLIAKRYLVLLPIVAAAVMLWVVTSGSVFGVGHGGSLGVIAISGSDADTLHGHAPYAIDIRDHLKQGSALPVLVLGDAAATAAYSGAVGSSGNRDHRKPGRRQPQQLRWAVPSVSFQLWTRLL